MTKGSVLVLNSNRSCLNIREGNKQNSHSDNPRHSLHCVTHELVCRVQILPETQLKNERNRKKKERNAVCTSHTLCLASLEYCCQHSVPSTTAEQQLKTGTRVLFHKKVSSLVKLISKLLT